MITRARAEGVRVTFTLETDEPVSVVGDFNGWDPAANPLAPRGKGRRSASIMLEPGTEVAFRYLAEGGRFFDDPDADRHEDNGHGETHSVLVIPPIPAAPRTAAASVRKAPAAKKSTVKKSAAKKPSAKASAAKSSTTG
jgi:1,4-alpha-glucan branching enzyme